MGIMAATVAPEAITVVTEQGETLTVTSQSHENYDKIREAIKNRDYDEAQSLIDLASEMMKRFDSVAGNVSIRHGVLYFGDRGIGGVLGDRAVRMHSEGFDMAPMFAFVENLYQNPSSRAVKELYGFLEACDLPITEDGCFLAYKMVRDDYKSHHDGKTDNSIGSRPRMERNAVDDNADRTCSQGLHFCSQGYLGSYASHGRTVIVKINPKDVVSIPTDYNNSKGRACEYEVVGEFAQAPTTKHKWESSVANENMMRTGRATSGRSSTISGGVTVMTDNLFQEGDVLFKRTVADYLDVNIEDIVRIVDEGIIESITNANGHKLVVWREDTADLIEDETGDGWSW